MGHPGKRPSKAERQLAEADAMAKLLATAPGSENDPKAPPAFLDERFAPALAVWKDYAPRLAHLNLLDPLYRHAFACFCIWVGEFVMANEDIQKHGYSRNVKTVSGSMYPRVSPAVGRRDTAMSFMLDLSTKFGFTPLDHYKLIREQATGFPGGGKPNPMGDLGDAAANKPEGASSSPVGAMSRMDSAPPNAKAH